MNAGRRPLGFGVFPEPRADAVEDLVGLVLRAEGLGLDLVGIQDHPYQRRYLDTWSLLAMLAGRTSRIRLFPDVANLPLRPPAMMAKAAASIDVLSEGRFEVGLGAGGFWDAIEAMGGPRREPRDALGALEEAIAVMRLMWSGERGLRFDGAHYRLAGVHSGPVPPHRISIWVGGYGPRMLELIGRAADGWLPSFGRMPLERLNEGHDRIDEAAAAAGRDPSSVRRLCNVGGTIQDRSGEGFLDGPPALWVERLTQLALEHRVESFILWPAEPVLEQVERFASEVVPGVREAAARG